MQAHEILADTCTNPSYLPIKNGFPCGSLLAHRAVLHPLHRHLVLSIQQLQSPAEEKSHTVTERCFQRNSKMESFL